MKLITKRNDHILFIYLPFILIAVSLIYFFRPVVLKLFEAHWILLLLAIFLLFLPRMWSKLQTPDKFSFFHNCKCFISIWGIQLGIYLVFLQIYAAITTLFPSQITAAKAVTQLNFHWGLFPWGLVTLLAVVTLIKVYQQKKSGSLSTIIFPWFRNTHEDAVGISADFLMRMSLYLAFSLTLGFIALRLSGFINQYLDPHLTILQGVNVFTMILTTFILVIIRNPNYPRMLTRIATVKIPLSLLFISFILIVAAGFSIISVAAFFLKFLTTTVWHSLDLSLLTLQQMQSIFIALWWLAWTPWLAGSIAHLARNQRPWFIISSTLSFPLGLALLNLKIPQIFNLLTSVYGVASEWGWILASFFLIFIVLQKKYLTEYLRAVLPKAHQQKQRSAVHYLRQLIQNAVLFDWFFILTGIPLICSVYFIFILPSYILMIAAALTILKRK
jgi:hypothetical protein